MWGLAVLAVLAAIAGLALYLAIQRNGPAVLDAVDRLTGGDRKVTLHERASIGEFAQQRLAVYGPEDRRSGDLPRPVILFVHGGSWASGDPDDYGFVARALVPEGFLVVLAGYRLYPESSFPEMIEDTARAVRWTRENIARLGGDPDRIVLAGHSAGAYNVAMVALDRQWLGREGQSADELAGVIGLSGPYDFYPFTNQSARNSFGSASRPADTQPISFVRGDAPPLLLIHGEGDTTVKPRNSRELARRIVEARGVASLHTFAGMDHNRPLLALASPWRSDPQIFGLVVEFARSSTASVPVQGETR